MSLEKRIHTQTYTHIHTHAYTNTSKKVENEFGNFSSLYHWTIFTEQLWNLSLILRTLFLTESIFIFGSLNLFSTKHTFCYRVMLKFQRLIP